RVTLFFITYCVNNIVDAGKPFVRFVKPAFILNESEGTKRRRAIGDGYFHFNAVVYERIEPYTIFTSGVEEYIVRVELDQKKFYRKLVFNPLNAGTQAHCEQGQESEKTCCFHD